VAVGGATGKLGRMVCGMVVDSDDMDLCLAYVSKEGGNVGKELYPGVVARSTDGILDDLRKESIDVYIDLTSPDAAASLIGSIPETGVALVLGTTAVPKDVLDRMGESVRANRTSALISSNFALGVNVFWKVCEDLAKALPDYDVEIIECHHNAKMDAPSGTALEALRRIQGVTGIDNVVEGRCGTVGARGREIGVHAVRAGDIVGDHTVVFARNMERLELTHRAISTETFAKGCVESIRWISGRCDGMVHGMGEVLGI